MKKILVLLLLISGLVKSQVVQPKSTTTFSNISATGNLTVTGNAKISGAVTTPTLYGSSAASGTLNIFSTSSATAGVINIGRSTDTINIKGLFNKNMPKQAFKTLVIGNSITAQCKWISSSGGYWTTGSEVHWANALAGSPMYFQRTTATTRMDQYCVYGYSGATSTTILSDLQGQVFTQLQNDNLNIDLVWLHSFVENDIASGASVSTMTANILSFILDAQARFPGVTLMISTPRPSFSYTSATMVSNYQSMVSYIQNLDNNYNIYVCTLNAYENNASPGTPLSGYTDASVHPNAKGALLLARTEAAAFNRISCYWKQPYFNVSSNMALTGSSSASGTNVSGTVPTNITITGAATGTFVGTAEQPGFTQSVSISSGTTVGAFIDLSTSNCSALSLTTTSTFQFSSFIKIQIVSGAQNINSFKLWPRITDGSGSPFIAYITAQTGDAQPTWQNGDILTLVMPPQVAVTPNITAINNYFKIIPNLIQDGTGFKIRVLAQGIGIVKT